MKPEKSNTRHGWRTVKLGEICERIDYGFTASADFSTQEPRFLRITDIQNGRVEWDSVPGCKISDAETEQNKLCDGDIVFARTGATTGKSFLIQSPPKAVFASYLIRMRLKEECDPEFFSLFLQGEDYWRQIRSQARGGAQPHFNASMLSALKVKLPNLPEQRRLTVWLREQLAEVERARVAVQAQLDAAENLPTALLREIFTSPAANHWPQKTIGDVARVQSGYAFKSDWFTDEGIRLLRNVNIAQGKTNWDQTAYLPENRRAEFPDYELHEGDIILSLDRPVVSGGLKLTRLTKQDLPALLLQRVGRFVLKDGVDANFLHCFLQTDGFIRKITAHDQSLGVPHVSPKQIEEIEIPLPALAVQRELAARLDTELTAARALVETLKTRLVEIELLPATLLRQAFTTPQN